MSDNEFIPRCIRIDNCMKKKGYLIESSENCTRKGKQTGFCN